MTFGWDLSVFPRIRLRFWLWRRKTTEAKYHFHHIIQRAHLINMTYDLLMSLITWQRQGLPDFSTVKLLLSPPFPNCTLWKKVTMCTPHLRSGELALPSWGQNSYFCTDLSLPPPVISFKLFSQLFYQYILTDIYFILQYYFIFWLSFVQLWPVGALSGGSYVHLRCHHHSVCGILFFKYFLTFWH